MSITNKVKLKQQLQKMGIQIKGNCIHKKDFEKVLAKTTNFYKTIIQIEVLSEGRFEWDSLEDISMRILDDCSGKITEISNKKISAKEAAKELISHNSDPAFFGLDDEGNFI